MTVATALCTLAVGQAIGSYAYYVGANLTEDGTVMLGDSGEEVSSHWLEIVPRRQDPRTPRSSSASPRRR